MYSPLLLATAALAPAVPAQNDAKAPEHRPASVTTPDYVYLDDVLGAKVMIHPATDVRRDAGTDKEPKKVTGEIKDLLLDCRSGAIEGAVVSFGGVLGIGDKTVALPANLLTWNGVNKAFDLNATEDQLKSLSAFDVKEARKRGVDNEMVVLRSSWSKFEPAGKLHGEASEASGRRDAPVKVDTGKTDERTDKPATDKPATQEAQKPAVVSGTTFVVVPGHYVVASDIDDHPVYAQGEKFGKISKCIVDRNARSLEFCVVSHGGALGIGDTEYLVPHRAMTLCRDGDNQIWCINRSAEQMKSAVKYEKPKHAGVVDLDAAKRAGAMY
jgi:hypothetical protein